MDLTSDHPYWTVKNGILADYPPLHSDVSCDIAILGAGITGALIAETLTAEGHDVRMLDARDVGRGSTSASTALLQYEIDTHLIDLIRMHGKRSAELAYRACHESIDLLDEKIRQLEIDCHFSRRESVYLASSENDWKVLRKEAIARRAINIQVQEWSGTEVAERFGFVHPGALHSVQAAQVDAYRLTHGLLCKVLSRGSRIHDRTRVTKITPHSKGVTLETDRGHQVKARKLIVASGYEATEMFGLSKVVDLRSSFALASEPMPERDFWWHQCLLWESARPYFYLRSDSDGRAILGGGDVPFRNPKARDRMLRSKATALEKQFRELFPGSPMEVAFCWAGTFGETEDGLAYIGPHQRYPHCFFALCFGGNGITFSMTAAAMVRDALAGKPNDYSEVFAFDR